MNAIRTVMILGLAAGAVSLGAAAQTVGPPISLRPPQMPAPAPATPAPAAPARPAAPPAVAPAGVAPAAVAPAVVPAPAPAPGSAPNSTMVPPPAAAEDVVRAFYAAAGAADGARANAYLVAEKRNHGPYEVRAMSDFYGAMSEPLRLLDAKEIMQGLVRVRYHYVHRSGRRCDGTADVTVVPSEGGLLIERIRAFNGC